MTEGAVFTKRGIVSVEIGTYRYEQVNVYDRGLEWIPISQGELRRNYRVNADASLSVITSDGITHLTFSVELPQDFTILSYNTYRQDNPGVPSGSFESRPYWQLGSRGKTQPINNWVRSDGVDVSGLDLTATNGAVVTRLIKSDSVGNDYCHFGVDFSASTIGEPVSIFLGNVLILYIARIT